MKHFITLLALITGLLLTGCESDNETHSHGEDGDHTHEQAAPNASEDNSEPVRIGSDAHSDDEESGHSHDEDSDHQHDDGADEDSTDHQNEEHSHDGDADHDH